MKTAQHKATVGEHVMLRRFVVGLTLAAAVALGSGPAAAQSGPICSKFDSGKDGWGPCSWAPNVTVTTSTSGGIGKDDPYLQITDKSGASAVCSSDPKYLGNWVEKMGACGQLCFDFKVFSSGIPPSAVTPSFSIYSGTSRATFYANFQVAIGDTSWHQKICAPIMLGDSAPPSPNGHWVISGGSWNSIITNVTMMSIPIDFSSSPSEIVGYDNICMSPGGCGEKPKDEITGCLKDSKIEVKCNPDGTYTLTLSGAGTAGDVITLVAQTSGVTVSPPQQPWGPTTTWTINGATPGQLVTLAANASKTGGGNEPGTDQCCSGEIKVVMPECEKKPPIDLKVEKENTPSGGQGNGFNVWVTNVGAPITFAPGELTVKDVVPAGLTISTQSSPNWTCNPLPAAGLVTITCTYNLSGSLGTNAQLTDSLVFSGVLTNKEQPLKNCAIVSIPATVGVDTNPPNDQACVTVSNPQVGELIVKKEAEYIGPILLPLQAYPVNFNCTGGPSGTLNVTPGTPQTVSNIPYGSTCTISEGTIPTPPNLCPATWTPVWTTTYVPSSSIPINAPSTTVTVKNKLTCQAPGDGILLVKKQVDQSSYEMNVSSLTFPATATCGGANYQLMLSALGPVTVGPLPLGTVCSVTEDVSSLPVLANTCPAGSTASWTVTTTPASATIGTTPVTIVVVNKFTCTPGQASIDVGIGKTGGTTPYCPAPYYSFSLTVTNVGSGFPATNNIVVTDVVPNGLRFDSATGTNWACAALPANAGSMVTCTYTGPAPTLGQVLPAITVGVTAMDPAPFPPYTNCATVALTSGNVDSNSANNNACVTVAKPSGCPAGMPSAVTTCQPPMVPGPVRGQCICGPGTVLVGRECVKQTTCQPPMVPGPVAGQCICPQGTVLRGKECVKQATCQPPMVPGPVAGQCICGPGTIPRGKTCVKETVCVSPAKSNGRGGCDCPEGMTKQGSNRCVKRERSEPRITPGDVINGIGIIRGLGGGGAGPTRGGGTPGKP
jgi:uncharacterized repeat protein (TIGR01451 family)